MSFTSWLRSLTSLFGRKQARRSKAACARKVRPVLELLEDRLAPANILPLASFNYSNGFYPHAGLVQDSSGNLFGTTSSGGPSGYGTVFEVTHGSRAITTLVSFNYSNGAYPDAELVQDSSGNLFGTTNSGGPGRHLQPRPFRQ